MRKVVAYELLSLDGVAEEPDAFITDFDEVMQDNLNDVIATQDTVLLGRRTYEEWARYWPASDIEPFATFINGVEKFVATSTPLTPAWSNSSEIAGNLATFVSDLKQRPGGDIGVHASITLVHSLLELGAIDELQLVVAPELRMHGRRLFERGLPTRLSLTGSSVSPSGCLLLAYRAHNSGHLSAT